MLEHIRMSRRVPRPTLALARRSAEIIGEFTLLRSIDPQAVGGEPSAKRGWITLKRSVSDMLHVNSLIRVVPTQAFTPTAPLRIATGAKDFEWRGNPYGF